MDFMPKLVGSIVPIAAARSFCTRFASSCGCKIHDLEHEIHHSKHEIHHFGLHFEACHLWIRLRPRHFRHLARRRHPVLCINEQRRTKHKSPSFVNRKSRLSSPLFHLSILLSISFWSIFRPSPMPFSYWEVRKSSITGAIELGTPGTATVAVCSKIVQRESSGSTR